MKLLLSSDALPAASLDVLGEAWRRQALVGLELVLGRGQGHRYESLRCPLEAGDEVMVPPVPVGWLALPGQPRLSELMTWAGEAHCLGAGLLLWRPPEELPRPIRVALVHSSNPAEVEAAVAWARQQGMYTCYQPEPETLRRGSWRSVLAQTLPMLAHVRLPGSGPEGQGDEAVTGVGAFLAQLAMVGFSGTVALIPSGPERLPEWEAWLLRRCGWGCGTAAARRACAAG
ncbi:MAG: hypothetical protein Q9M35_02960 [Rhodothermus sp.]|nr:hypothetical protein [Rhodothermus sp.]